MKNKLAIKILKISISIMLSVAFIFGVVAVPFYYSITALTKPETVAMVIREIDYKTVINKNPKLKKSLDNYGITASEADTVMKSNKIEEAVEIYADEVKEIISDIPENKTLDSSYIKKIVQDNTDKFIDIAKEKTDWKINEDVAKTNVDGFLEKNEVIVEETVEVIKEVKNIVKKLPTSRAIERKMSIWTAVLFLALALGIIGVIVFLLRSNGFFIVAVDFAVASIIIALIVTFGKSSFISAVTSKMSDFGVQIVESAVSISIEKMLIVLFAAIILMVIFMGFFVAIKILKYKYQNEKYINIEQ